ncbi:MAG: hypothetical protein K1X67_03315 [Fimbriimonadaceae bacterium]|nr:hypothetical protein [Fimbriimonadaceae bacterium]
MRWTPMRWLSAIVFTGILALGSTAIAQDGGLGKKGKGSGGNSSGGSSGKGSGGSGKSEGGGRPERPPVRENNPPPQRPPVREANPPRTNPDKDRSPDRNPDRVQDGGLGKGSGSGGGRPERPPIREQNPPRSNPNPDRNGSRDQGGGLGKKNDDRGQNNGGNPGSIIRGGSSSDLGRNRDGDRQDLRGNADSMLGRRPQGGRSGQPQYNGNNNLLSNGRVRDTKPVVINRLPDLRKGSLESQVLREGTPNRVRDRGNHWDNGWNDYNWRNGYCQYDYRWRDNYFSYPYYSFTFNDRCAISPWYYYPNLPGYIVSSRVRIGNFGLDIRWGNSFDWNRYDRWDRYSNDYEFGRAIDDIRDAFERGSTRSLGYLIPSRSEVYVRLDDGYGYTMDGDDFYDLMVDNISATQTRRYMILEARWGSRGEASVLASHEFLDPWGSRQCVYHRYVLVDNGRGFRIAQFEVSQSRFRW